MRKTLIFKVTAISIGVIISLIAGELLLRVQNFVDLSDFSEKTKEPEIYRLIKVMAGIFQVMMALGAKVEI